MMDRSFAEQIKEKTITLGFSKVGIASPNLPESIKYQLSKWIQSGYHASMDWMARRSEERLDVYKYFPEVRTVISVALNYFTGRTVPAPDSLKISNYAWGDDYHDLVKHKLYKLLEMIKSKYPNVKSRVCVDTSPVPDKLWAVQAGLGWQGKNTNLITKEFGSWLFLGELMLDIELETDAPFEADHCGSCSACLEACPTNAFPEPYVLDANRCISYLTIEHKGNFPNEFENTFNGWIYGCDICQQVCPWNVKFEKLSENSEFRIRDEIKFRSQEEWRFLSKEEFQMVFKNSAVKRTKFEGLKRNIKFASKNVGRKQTVK
ncbi:MAG: tRNA epoxyqueuosine(34) reductase QueG [Fidelibacterota bacterium]